MSIKEWIKWDYSEVEDPSYKNELKADRFLGITLFFVGVISFLCLILQICGVFNFDSNTEIYIFFSLLIFFSLSGSLIAYLTNGKKPYVKFALMLDLVVIAIAADMFLAFYAVLILAIPFVCSSKYSDLKICKNVGMTMCVLVLLNGFIAFFTNVQKDINIQSSKAGKIKTWFIALTVIILYLAGDINKLTILVKH